MKPNCYLHALSSYVPAEVLTNDDLSKLVETNDEWITTRTGIKRRHRLPQDCLLYTSPSPRDTR